MSTGDLEIVRASRRMSQVDTVCSASCDGHAASQGERVGKPSETLSLLGLAAPADALPHLGRDRVRKPVRQRVYQSRRGATMTENRTQRSDHHLDVPLGYTSQNRHRSRLLPCG